MQWAVVDRWVKLEMLFGVGDADADAVVAVVEAVAGPSHVESQLITDRETSNFLELAQAGRVAGVARQAIRFRPQRPE